MWNILPPTQPRPVTVRVYVVRAIDLQPQDTNGGCDAYICLNVNHKRLVKDSKEYVPASLNPFFGKSFDVEMTLPQESELRISVWDHDHLSADDCVGETVIDIEERLMARCFALSGLPQTFMTEGMNAWRLQQKPRQLLEELCTKNNLPLPEYSDNPSRVWVKTYLPQQNGRRTFTCKGCVYEYVVVWGGEGRGGRLALSFLPMHHGIVTRITN